MVATKTDAIQASLDLAQWLTDWGCDDKEVCYALDNIASFLHNEDAQYYHDLWWFNNKQEETLFESDEAEEIK